MRYVPPPIPSPYPLPNPRNGFKTSPVPPIVAPPAMRLRFPTQNLPASSMPRPPMHNGGIGMPRR